MLMPHVMIIYHRTDIHVHVHMNACIYLFPSQLKQSVKAYNSGPEQFRLEKTIFEGMEWLHAGLPAHAGFIIHSFLFFGFFLGGR